MAGAMSLVDSSAWFLEATCPQVLGLEAAVAEMGPVSKPQDLSISFWPWPRFRLQLPIRHHPWSGLARALAGLFPASASTSLRLSVTFSHKQASVPKSRSLSSPQWPFMQAEFPGTEQGPLWSF